MGNSVGDYSGRRSAKVSRTVRACAELVGSPDLTYMGCPFLLPPPNRPLPTKALSFLSQARGRNLQGGGHLSWFPDGPSASPNPSQDSPSCPLGILMIPLFMFLDFIMTEARVRVLRSIFGPWIHENSLGNLFLVMRRCYG